MDRSGSQFSYFFLRQVAGLSMLSTYLCSLWQGCTMLGFEPVNLWWHSGKSTSICNVKQGQPNWKNCDSRLVNIIVMRKGCAFHRAITIIHMIARPFCSYHGPHFLARTISGANGTPQRVFCPLQRHTSWQPSVDQGMQLLLEARQDALPVLLGSITSWATLVFIVQYWQAE